MKDQQLSEEQRQQRGRATKTAWLLGFIALAIFATFIGSAVIGR